MVNGQMLELEGENEVPPDTGRLPHDDGTTIEADEKDPKPEEKEKVLGGQSVHIPRAHGTT